jgi:hypothetical protein
MSYDLIPGSELAQQVGRAMARYREGWQSVDSELYELCRRRSNHEDFDDTYAKVVLISRVYSAGLNRAWRGARGTDIPGPEVQVAKCLVSQAALAAELLKELADQPFDRASLAKIISLHGQLTSVIRSPAGDVRLTSFVSKYLHFHCPVVPVYDSRANARIRRGLVDRTRVRSVLAAVPEPEVTDPFYYRFAAMFLGLYERINAESSLQPSVKEVDYLLLGNGSQN